MTTADHSQLIATSFRLTNLPGLHAHSDYLFVFVLPVYVASLCCGSSLFVHCTPFVFTNKTLAFSVFISLLNIFCPPLIKVLKYCLNDSTQNKDKLIFNTEQLNLLLNVPFKTYLKSL